MKNRAQILTHFLLWFVAALFLFVCNSELEVDFNNESPADNLTVGHSDNFSDHLQLSSAIKNQGNAREAQGDYLRLTPTSSTRSGRFIKTRGGFIWQNPYPLTSSFDSPGALALVTPGRSAADGVVNLFSMVRLLVS